MLMQLYQKYITVLLNPSFDSFITFQHSISIVSSQHFILNSFLEILLFLLCRHLFQQVLECQNLAHMLVLNQVLSHPPITLCKLVYLTSHPNLLS